MKLTTASLFAEAAANWWHGSAPAPYCAAPDPPEGHVQDVVDRRLIVVDVGVGIGIRRGILVHVVAINFFHQLLHARPSLDRPITFSGADSRTSSERSKSRRATSIFPL